MGAGAFGLPSSKRALVPDIFDRMNSELRKLQYVGARVSLPLINLSGFGVDGGELAPIKSSAASSRQSLWVWISPTTKQRPYRGTVGVCGWVEP